MNINDRIAKNLENVIEKSGQKLAAICREAQVNQPAAHKFITRNQERIALEDLIKLANYFKVPIQYFWGDESPSLDIPLENYEENSADYDYIKFYDVKVSAGSGMPAENESTRLLPVERSFITRLGYPSDMLSAVEVMGDSMEPTLRNGDYVIIYRPEYSTDFVPGIYVIRDFSGLKVKRLDMDKFGNLNVISDNKFYMAQEYTQDEMADEAVKIIGRVLGKIGII